MNIVVCVDENKQSEIALDKAVEYVNNVNIEEIELTLIHSLNVGVSYDNNNIIQKSKDNKISRIENKMAELKSKVYKNINKDINIESVILDTENDDSVVDSIVNYISNENIYQVFIGHRALKKKHEKLYGSFAKQMIAKSPVPVVVTTKN